MNEANGDNLQRLIGEGYRLLKEGEPRQNGDEFILFDTDGTRGADAACADLAKRVSRRRHNAELSGGEAVRSDDLLAQFGPRLTPEEVTECIALSGEPCCQACGREWKDHHQRCEGSANKPSLPVVCSACGKPKDHHRHIKYGNDLDNPVKHEFTHNK